MQARQGYKLVQGEPRYIKFEIPEERDYVNLSSIIQKPEKGIWGDESEEAAAALNASDCLLVSSPNASPEPERFRLKCSLGARFR